MSPLTAPRALDQFFLEARCRLLDLAAILDRVGRGDNTEGIKADPRLNRILQALEVLSGTEGGRAEQIQKIFSLDYDPDWKKPQPRY